MLVDMGKVVGVLRARVTNDHLAQEEDLEEDDEEEEEELEEEAVPGFFHRL